MESLDEEDDLKLVKASAGLLSDLENALPKLLWKPSKTGSGRGNVHKSVKPRDLEYVIKLIEPFQGEPQLLDARLKTILPPIVNAYTEYILLKRSARPDEHLDLQSAICVILYTLCKVRGYKVIVGFFNNEPKYLEPILTKLEDILAVGQDAQIEWQVPYVLLLWLSHLLLTPFDLASISNTEVPNNNLFSLELKHDLPPLAVRILRVGLTFLPSPTKAQDASAMLLLRLVMRPDMQRQQVADAVVSKAVRPLQNQAPEVPVTIYERLGPLRLLSGIASAAELEHLIPSIYRTCEELSRDESSPVISNAVAKKLVVKTLRNIAILALRSEHAEGPLLSFLQSTSVLEDVIDCLLRSLGDRDTPVRYAAAKALSRIVLELDPAMSHEVIQAVLDTFKEDIPRNSDALDFRTVNALKWHGLTLALAHTLFKRSASPEQLPDIVNALVCALQFEQRAATGSSVGTNVRDAANFGIWSLSRRYTTNELLLVEPTTITTLDQPDKSQSVIQAVAIQLILSACLDPVGNIRRGSSAALQELIGRHPNEVLEGISLVQIVDYQAVGLRRRAMVDVAARAAELESMYWNALINGLLGWRGIGSSDVQSREAAAASLATFSTSRHDSGGFVLFRVQAEMTRASSNDLETLHGLVLSMATLFDGLNNRRGPRLAYMNGQENDSFKLVVWDSIDLLQDALNNFSPRLLRSELPAATAALLGALCRYHLKYFDHDTSFREVPFWRIDTLVEKLLNRHEETIQQAIPPLVNALIALKRKSSEPLGCIGAQSLCKRIRVDGLKSTLQGACRAIALGALAPLYQDGLEGEKAKEVISTLAALVDAMTVDWRIVGIKSIQVAIDNAQHSGAVVEACTGIILDALYHGLRDYTVDERGDIGSLVRLQAIACARSVFGAESPFVLEVDVGEVLSAEIYRLSLEKLDRVRLEAALCRYKYLDVDIGVIDAAYISSYEYFHKSLRALSHEEPDWKHRPLIEGLISCAGVSAEAVLQASRTALVHILNSIQDEHFESLMSTFADILRWQLLKGTNIHPALELLSFMLDMKIPQRLVESDFKWRNLLSIVQKSHHKSNDIPKILAALSVYRGLSDIPSIREEVLKKLISMLKTNPYPRVRSSVAETLFVITQEPAMKSSDWMKPASQHLDVIESLQKRYVNI